MHFLVWRITIEKFVKMPDSYQSFNFKFEIFDPSDDIPDWLTEVFLLKKYLNNLTALQISGKIIPWKPLT